MVSLTFDQTLTVKSVRNNGHRSRQTFHGDAGSGCPPQSTPRFFSVKAISSEVKSNHFMSRRRNWASSSHHSVSPAAQRTLGLIPIRVNGFFCAPVHKRSRLCSARVRGGTAERKVDGSAPKYFCNIFFFYRFHLLCQ